ncbi:hypothetical protein H632_c317p2 [Helicosporidium sp. ATCC 50920]|nr:hypothetical protein H632_c317p2 [Helicosporidium sp. ATCC 50920]|eukprot:KDD76202.1 hypothetical protein H632_c317p2 [Helicosporidium sp. ATCC 50920]
MPVLMPPRAAAIPNLEWLILTNNKMTNLQDLDPLSTLPRLRYLSLVGNPMTLAGDYRLYAISRCRQLKMLDFKKVGAAERAQADARFPPGAQAPAQAAAKPTAVFDPEEDVRRAEARLAAGASAAEEADRKAPSEAQLTAVRAAIAAATTLEEVRRLESALAAGQVPALGEGRMDVE